MGRTEFAIGTGFWTPGTDYTDYMVTLSDGPECVVLRVVAVDEAGNESLPSQPQEIVPEASPPSWCVPPYDPPSPAPEHILDAFCQTAFPVPATAATCPVTAPTVYWPENVEAHTDRELPYACYTDVTWDPVPDAVKYHVHRFDFLREHDGESQRLRKQRWTRIAEVSAANCCEYEDQAYDNYDPAPWRLQAYYVTAVGVDGSESPPSDVVFWQCTEDPTPYVRLELPEETLPDGWPGRGEELEWLASSDGVDECFIEDAAEYSLGSVVEPSTAPLLTLGQSPPVPPYSVRHLHVDHLGSTRVVTQDYSIVATHDYFPFGEEIQPVFDYATKRFTGHERDQATGLDYMLARYYGANLGRFLSTDPRGGGPRNPQSWNRYAYTLNNPLNLVDPNGECSAPAGGNGVCIEAFIAAPRIGGVGLGDNRGFSATDATLTSRVEVQIAADSAAGTFDVQTTAGFSSVFVEGLGRQGSATTTITDGQTLADGTMSFTAEITATNGLSFLPGAPKESIDMSISMEIAPDGQASIQPGSTADGYPSIGVYGYSEGEPQTLYEGDESTPDDLAPPMEREIPATEKKTQ